MNSPPIHAEVSPCGADANVLCVLVLASSSAAQVVSDAVGVATRVTHASRPDVAIELGMSQDFDLVLLDAALDGANLAVEVLTAAGCPCPIVTLDFSSQDGAAWRQHAAAAAARRAARNPRWMAAHAAEVEALAAEFRKSLPLSLDRLEHAADTGDMQAVRAISHVLKGCGTTYGMPSATRGCGDIATLLDREEFDAALALTRSLVASLRTELGESA